MSLSNALSNAVSGIVATSRGTEVVASNLANSLTPGFARRELQTSGRLYTGGGVHVDGVTRVVRQSVLAQSRVTSAETARAQTLANFQKTLADKFGVPGEAGALTTRVADLESALISAAARPDNETALAKVVSTAQALATGYAELGVLVQDARTQADQDIARDVATLNDGLTRISELNRQITVQIASGDDSTALQDIRQQLIDKLAEIVPIQELPRENGRVALFTTSGAPLLDGHKPTTISFEPAGKITANMQPGDPRLSGISLDGVPLSASQHSMFAGGRLAANFQLRDVDAPAAQLRLDAAARDLIERFTDPTVDPTGAGTGFFTDGGAAFDPLNEVGLAQRLQVSSLVDPAAGGALWRVRDGLGAPTPGPVGQSALLDRLRETLSAQRAPLSTGVSPAMRSAATMAAEITSIAATGRISAEATLSAATAQSESFADLMMQDGVDSDREMETLLSLERAYAANAKVLAAVDDMIRTILELT